MVVTKRLNLPTEGNGQVVNLNDAVTRQVAASAITQGTVTIFVTATTAGVTIMEHEPGLVQDLKTTMDRLIPRSLTYQHNVLNNDVNGHSHTQAIMIGPSVAVPVIDGKPLLGTWQSIVLIDFDARPRNREIVLQIMGE